MAKELTFKLVDKFTISACKRQVIQLTKLLGKWFSGCIAHIAQCDLCLQDCQRYSLLCQHCAKNIPIFNFTSCYHDLLLLPEVQRLFKQIHFDQLICLSPYQYPFNKWIPALKYQRRIEVAQLLSDLFIEKVFNCSEFDNSYFNDFVLIPVPLSHKKYKTRLFNQANVLAKPVAKHLGVFANTQILKRVKEGDSQVGQSGSQRRKNLRGAFSLITTNLPEKVIIFDDVVTTGSTVNEMAKLLKSQGVKQVVVMSICLTLEKH